MINVVGRPPLDAAGVRLCTFEHVLCDTSSMPCDWLPCHSVPCHTEELREAAMVNGTVPITLENLGQIRRDPCCSAENFVLDSCDDAARELESAFGAEGGAVVCDLTTVDEGRDVDGLARVAARLGESVAVCFGASLPAADVARGSEDEIRVALERQLVVGVDVAADVVRNFAAGAPAAPRAAFVGPLRPVLDEGLQDPLRRPPGHTLYTRRRRRRVAPGRARRRRPARVRGCPAPKMRARGDRARGRAGLGLPGRAARRPARPGGPRRLARPRAECARRRRRLV